MTIKSNFPSIRPSLNLDFANTRALDPRITFTRTTTATYYDGKTTAKAEENLLLQSQDFSTTWTNSGSSETINTEVAPDGTTTADTIIASATTAAHFMNQGITLVVGQQYVYSVFLKAGTNDYAQLTLGTQSAFANFDLDLGVTGTSGGSIDSSSITSVGNGWYRCVMIFTQVNANSVVVSVASSDSDTRLQAWTALGTETIIAWGAQLEQRSAVSSYTATTTQPITNYIPALQTAASGVARFDHRPLTGESLGLLVEEQRTNLFERSEEFDNAYWTKTRSSITANTIVAPDGTLTGDKVVEDTTADNTHQITRSISYTSGTAYTYSFFAKAGERTRVAFQFPSAAFTNPINITFNLSDGSVVAVGTGGTASIVSVGNGWFRCIGTATATITASVNTAWVRLVDTGTNASYTGDGYSGIFIWGAQLEAGAFPTSYIPTVAATVTRNADVASMTGTNFSSWYRQDEGTFYSESVVGQIGVGSVTLAASDATASNRLQIQRTAGNNYQNLVVVGGVTQSSVSVSGVAANVSGKSADAFKLNDFNTAVNGVLGTADTSGTVPTVTQLDIGSRASSLFLNGHIRKLSYYPIRATDAQLQALTTV